MSTFLEVAGGRARVRITPINQTTFATLGAGTFYNIQKIVADDDMQTGDTTNTEGGSTPSGETAAEEIPTKGQVMVDITHASYDPTLNLFATPLILSPGLRIMLELFPNGITSIPYLFPIFLIKKRRWEPDAAGLQPVTLSGVSIGPWSVPA